MAKTREYQGQNFSIRSLAHSCTESEKVLPFHILRVQRGGGEGEGLDKGNEK